MAVGSLSISCQPVCIYNPACLLVYRLSVYLCAFLTVGSLSTCCQPACIYHPACLFGCRLSVIPTAAWLFAACQSAASLSVFTILSACLAAPCLSTFAPFLLLLVCQSAASLSVFTILPVCLPLRLFDCCLSVGLHSYINVCLIFLIFLLQK